LVAAVQRLEHSSFLNAAADRVAPIVDTLLSSGRGRDVLQGRWMGHALHPLMTDFPIGAWTCTSLLDLFGGGRSRPAAEGLLLFGLVTAVPTYASGWAEWTTTSGAARRVGLVHAASNVAGVGLYGSSFLARRRDRHLRGVALALAGGMVVTVGGYLGGHLAIVRRVGTSDPAFDRTPAAGQGPAGSPPGPVSQSALDARVGAAPRP